MTDITQRFFEGEPFAVVGASQDRTKFGNQVLRSYVKAGMVAFPVNPKEKEIEGLPVYASIADLPETVTMVSVITPPRITESIVEEAAAEGVKIVWMQPGAESDGAIERAEELGLEVIAGGPCVLVELPRWRLGR